MICFFTLGQFECWTSRGGSRGALWQGMSVKWQRLFNMRHLHFSVTHPTLGTPGLGFIGYAIAGGVMFWKLGEQGKLDATEVFPGKVSLRSGPPAAAADCVGSAKVQFKQCTFCTFAGFANWGNCGAAAGRVSGWVWYIAHRLSS